MKKNYSTFINLTKKICWIISAGLLYLLFNSQTFEVFSYNKNSLGEKQENNNQVILKPRFFSSDNKNRPFTLTASKAQKKSSTEDLYNLTSPSGQLRYESGNRFDLESQKGVFDQINNKIHLYDDVIFKNNEGYTFETDSIFINLGSEKIYGNQSIFGTGDNGKVKSEGFEIIDGGEEIRFLGKTKLVIINP